MQAIDPAILAMIEDGRAVAAKQEAKAKAEMSELLQVEQAQRDKAWSALETAVAQLLPDEIAQHAVFDRDSKLPGLGKEIEIRIPQLVPFSVWIQKGNGGWTVYSYQIVGLNIVGKPEGSKEFRANELPLCLAAVANETERQSARKAAVLDYEITVAEWRKAHDEAEATIMAMTNSLQKEVCEHYGDRFALWNIHYNYMENDEVGTGTAVVLENETDALGFWRVVNRMGEVRRIAYSSVYAIEVLGDFAVTDRQYTKRLYGDKLGTIYLPPYVTDAEMATAKQMLAEAEAAAPELPEQPRPQDMETAAVLFENWELDWLYAHTGGDADN